MYDNTATPDAPATVDELAARVRTVVESYGVPNYRRPEIFRALGIPEIVETKPESRKITVTLRVPADVANLTPDSVQTAVESFARDYLTGAAVTVESVTFDDQDDDDDDDGDQDDGRTIDSYGYRGF